MMMSFSRPQIITHLLPGASLNNTDDTDDLISFLIRYDLQNLFIFIHIATPGNHSPMLISSTKKNIFKKKNKIKIFLS